MVDNKKRARKVTFIALYVLLAILLVLVLAHLVIRFDEIIASVTNRGDAIIIVTGIAAALVLSFAIMSYALFNKRKFESANAELLYIYNNVSGGIIKRTYGDGVGKIVSASDGFLSIMKYSRAELQEKFDDSFFKMIYPADVAEAKRAFTECVEKGTKIMAEYRVVSKTGKMKWLLDKGNIAEEDGVRYMYSVIVDISRIKEAEAQMRVTNERYRVATKYMNKMLFDFDVSTRTLVNTVDLFGWGVPPTIQNIPEAFDDMPFVLKESVVPLKNIFYSVIDGAQNASGEIAFKLKNGEKKWYRVTLIALDDGEQARKSNIFGIVEDIDIERNLRGKMRRDEQYRKFMMTRSHVFFEVDLAANKVLSSTPINLKDGRAVKFDGKTTNEVIGALLYNVHSDFKGAVTDVLKTAGEAAANFNSAEHEFAAEIKYDTTNSGKYIWERLMVYLFKNDVSGNVCGFVYLIDIDEEKQRELDLLRMSELDPLTQIYNKSVFETKADAKMAAHPTGKYAYLTFDIDNFKQFNDTKGHAFGDTILVGVTEQVARSIKADELFGRVGGDEFSLLIDGSDKKEVQRRASELLRLAKSVCYKYGHNNGISIGIAFAPEDATDFRRLAKFADRALYEAKRLGKGQFANYVKNS